MTTDSKIQQAITDAKASFAASAAALERLYAAKHETIADAHGEALAAETKARRAVEADLERTKARAADAEARAAKAERRSADLEGALARSKAEAAGAEALHVVERTDRDHRLNEASARIAELEARLAAGPLVIVAPVAITAPDAPQA